MGDTKVLVRFADRQNVIALVSHHYPRVYQIALALCADQSTALDVARHVLRVSLLHAERWESDEDAERWLAHFTVLTSRQILPLDLDPTKDALLSVVTDPLLLTLLRTVRTLPMQQREAFLLHHGLGFELRPLSTAMDCSSAAAANHLVAAVAALREVADHRLADFTNVLPKLLTQLTPPPRTLEADVNRAVRRQRQQRWLSCFALWLTVIIFLLATAWIVLHVLPMIVI